MFVAIARRSTSYDKECAIKILIQQVVAADRESTFKHERMLHTHSSLVSSHSFSLNFLSHFISFCSEENVWKLCEQVKKMYPNELSKCYAVFVSNERRTVPLWRQKAGRGEDKLVVWVSFAFSIC